MKILVTGGAGFIGKHLVRYLIERGHMITVFDNFSNSTKSIINQLVDKGIRIIDGDITELQQVLNAIKDCDVVVHLAAKISVKESIENPSETFRVNVDGTKNVLVSCKENHIKKIIIASSAAVYGEGSPDINLTENLEMKPISPYGVSKALMEQEVKKFACEYNINYVILRFFNIFGFGQTPEYAGVITKFIQRITNDEPLEIFGDGMQTRDFVSVQDVVESIHNAILFGNNGTYNIASGRSISINELAEFMISLSGKNLKIIHTSPRKGEIRHSQADISLAKRELKYSPKIGLEEIKKLLE